MTALDLLQQSQALLLVATLLLGLVVGSFLNVLIHRLPIMLQRIWGDECRHYLGLAPILHPQPFNLLLPRSHCPSCLVPIRAIDNIPLLSYCLLGGKCADCNQRIGWRYPAIEILSATLSAFCAYHFGYGAPLGFALILLWGLIVLSFIDIQHQLLPDIIVLPLLSFGLLLSVFGVYTTSYASIVGAIGGYMFLWLVYQAYKLLTGKEGMGYGDFKLLALLGAWLGWQQLLLVVILASLLAIISAATMLCFGKKCTKLPFAPFLATAGMVALFWGGIIGDFYWVGTGLAI